MRSACIFVVAILLALAFVGCQPRSRQERTPDAYPNILPDDNMFFIPPGETEEYIVIEEDIIEQPDHIDYLGMGGRFELPVAGATGFAGTYIPLYEHADENSTIIVMLAAGQGFTILAERGEWWYIEVNNTTGWVLSRFCLINLPDIIPSIVHYNTNTFSSLFKSSGIEIPNVTGVALYQARDFNFRLGREEFIAPVLYSMAGRVFAAQQAALADGNTLIIYEAFRPHDAHQVVFYNFLYLIETNPIVMEGVTSGWFTINWFLAPSPYNHQRGTAIDVSLGRIISKETKTTGDFSFIHITEFEEFPMQTMMHELSGASAIFAGPVYSRSQTAWRYARLADSVTEGTVLLLRYMTDAGLTPLASEWWHFNDLEATAEAIEMGIMGRFSIERSFSRPVVVE